MAEPAYLDYASYPHLVEHIVSFADRSCWPALRATCRRLHDALARRMYTHIAGYAGFTVELFAPSTSEPVSHRVPGLQWPEPAIANLTPHLDILDLEDARVYTNASWTHEQPASVQQYNVAARARVIRRWAKKYQWHVGWPFYPTNVRKGQLLILFIDYTVIPAVQEIVAEHGAALLNPEIAHMPKVSVRPCFASDRETRSIVNVRYDPRQPDLRNGTFEIHWTYPKEEVVVIFTPTELWSGPEIPKNPEDPDWVDPDPPMGWLNGLAEAVWGRFGPSSMTWRSTRLVFVGAEQLDASWVDSNHWRFSNPLTNTDLAAGLAKTAEDMVFATSYTDVSGKELTHDEMVRCVFETLDYNGGWDGLFRFITLDEWRAEVDSQTFELATIPPAKPSYVPFDSGDTVEARMRQRGGSPSSSA
ncbi:uncharacterized protein LOC62_02G003462 [Vanrija pseudolonga]|uniref:Uncharacterized protein n=1 Tax=Vanrija pseudolonga TaxID=143232 RepID=A0AAF1BPX2_9TREE|nr:hypothetical protein LOC62_02G003462 [Vanrija pseudolonga]